MAFIRKVMNVYIKRNPMIGYCQGMNFIVSRLAKYLKQED